jgi:hypothetical protein
MHNYDRRTATSLECRLNGSSMAWIGKDGRVYYMRSGLTHDEWAGSPSIRQAIQPSS